MFDTEKFICEIEAQPALYNITSKDYSNRVIKAKCWNLIAKAMYEDWESPELTSDEKDERVKDLMRKWKTLRDSFVKDHRSVMASGAGKAASSKKRYVYYEQLQFILPYVKGNPNTGSNIAPRAPITSDASNIEAEQDDVIMTVNIESTNNGDGNAVTKKCSNTSKRKIENPNVVAGKQAASERSVANSAKELTNVFSSYLKMQQEEKYCDKYGNMAFLLSFVPVLDSMPFEQSMLLRGQVSNVFTDYYLNQQFPSSSRSPMSGATRIPASETSTDISEDCYN